MGLGRFRGWLLSSKRSIKRAFTHPPLAMVPNRRQLGLPLLPPELESYIFKICARSSRRASARLILVARRVQIWIEPIMYEKLILSKDFSKRKKLLRAISMAPDKFAEHVKYVCFPFESIPNDAVRVLAICKRILYIAWWTSSPPYLLLNTITSHRPTRVSLRCSSDMRLNFSHPFFADVTHLELVVPTPEPPLMELHLLPRLTHLRLIVPVDNIYMDGFVRDSLARCRGVQACLLRYKTAPFVLEAYSEVSDSRVVMVPYKDPAADWEAVINGLPDMWAAANTFIQQRQRQLETF